MKKVHNHKFSSTLSWVLKGILIGLFIFSTFTGQFPLNITIFIAVGISFSPVLVSRRYDFHFPPLVDLLITGALIFDSVGRVFKLYHTTDYWWWDIVAHTLGTATVSILAFYIVFSMMYTKSIKLPYWMVGLIIFSFAMMIGSLWEISEFYFDRFTGYNTYLNEANSIRDMLFDVIGGLIVAFFGAYYTRHVIKSRRKEHIFQ